MGFAIPEIAAMLPLFLLLAVPIPPEPRSALPASAASSPISPVPSSAAPPSPSPTIQTGAEFGLTSNAAGEFTFAAVPERGLQPDHHP